MDKDTKLAVEIDLWFEKNKNNKNLWNNNEIGKTIKRSVTKKGNWKNAPRGNPAAGYQKALTNKTNNW